MIDAKEFAEKVMAEATALGFECTLVCNGLVAHNHGVDKIMNGTSIITFPHNTMRDVYKYIMAAKRDEVGMHTIIDGDGSEGSFVGLHIYNNKHQVNICTGKNMDESLAIGIIMFDPTEDEVKFYRVNTSGVADYANPSYSTMGTQLININWGAALGPNGEKVYRILTNILRGAPSECVIQANSYNHDKSTRTFDFNDLWNFVNSRIQPGERLTVPNPDSVIGEAYTFVRMTDPTIIDFHWRNHLYEGLGMRVCRFIFKDDPEYKWKTCCQITNCDTNGNIIISRTPVSVCGDTPITMPKDTSYVMPDNSAGFSFHWHCALESDKGRGLKIRNKLDDILRGWHHK